jgi:cyclophilin family peptidyl-prolyl cis-trans isomerase
MGTVQRHYRHPSANRRSRLVDSRPVAKQAKRERQRLNRETRRQAELAATKRRKQMRTGRNIAILAVPLVIVFVFFQLRSSGGSEPDRTFSKPPALTIDPAKTYSSTIDTSEGKMVVALDAANAPKSVNNFVFLARKHFYDGLTFHRVAKDFVIQGGDPKGDGSGGPGYQLKGADAAETPANGYQVGSVAWAKGESDPPGTAGSQFFIITSQAQGLDALNQPPYQYGIIGQVLEGLDVAQKIGALAPPSGDGKPTKKVTIKKVTITEAPAATLPTEAPSAPPSS